MFGMSPDQSAVATDVYGNPPQSPTNNLPNSASSSVFGSAFNQLLGQGGGGKNVLSNIVKDMSKNYRQTGSMDLSSALGSTCKSLGITKPNMADVRGLWRKSLVQSLGVCDTPLGHTLDGVVKAAGGTSLQKTLLGGSREVNLLVGNVKTTAKKIQDINSIQGLSSLIDSVSGSTGFIKVFNLTDTLSMFQGINNLSKEFGIPGVLDKIISQYNDNDKKQIVTGLVKNNPTLYDINFIETLGKTLSTSEIIANNPDTVKGILSDFKPTTDNPYPTSDLCNRLVNALVAIDPHWDKVAFNGDWIQNLEIFRSCSSFTKQCFTNGDVYVPEMALVSTWGVSDPVQVSKALYPYYPVIVKKS